jgi:predicted lipoprotein with Yx(FWY)xxD motif
MRLRLAVGLVITVVAAFSAVAAQAGPAPLVITTAHTSLGTILTNGARTVYLSLADSSGHSRCTGSCAAVWPPVKATGPLKAAGGVKASLLGEIALHGGGKQVTYDHHPLYYFASDKQHW